MPIGKRLAFNLTYWFLVGNKGIESLWNPYIRVYSIKGSFTDFILIFPT